MTTGTKGPEAWVDIAASVPCMSQERGASAARSSVSPASAGPLGLLLVIAILRLVILLGWRDGGRATD
jgi:hypothetical protein